MNKLAEKRSLVALARKFGQEPSTVLLDEIAHLEIEEERQLQREAAIRSRVAADLQTIFEGANLEPNKPKSVSEVAGLTEAIKAGLEAGVLEITGATGSAAEPAAPAVPAATQQPSNVDKVAKVIAEAGVVAPDPVLARPQKNLEMEIRRLDKWISRIAAAGAGSGEVWFRRLNDVNRSTMEDGNDNWVLEYDAATQTVKFTNNIGPIETLSFDTNHNTNTSHSSGTVCWNNADRTVNVFQPDGVTLQVGQEQQYLVANTGATTIANGTFVRFAGATQLSSGARLVSASCLSDGSHPTLYSMGVATQDIVSGGEGIVTAFGKVRDLDTTGAPVGETWYLGDILYGHPTVTGALTRFKPTAPYNVVPVASVVYVHATRGEIFVRPTIEQPWPYARYRIETDISTSSVNTGITIRGYQTVVANGFYLNSSHTGRIYATTSGFYDFDVVLQLRSTNASAKNFWVWAHLHDGTSVASTARRKTLVGNDVYDLVSCNFTFSMQANDYVELHYAVDNPAIIIEATPATAFAPQAPSVSLTVTQLAL